MSADSRFPSRTLNCNKTITVTDVTCHQWLICVCVCVPPGQVFVLVEVLEEGRLADELLLLTDLLTGAAWISQFDLQGAERRPHHLTVAEVLTTQHGSYN